MSFFDLFECLIVDSHFIGVDSIGDTSDSKRMTFDLMGEIKINVENATWNVFYLCSEWISWLLRVTTRFPERVELASSIV